METNKINSKGETTKANEADPKIDIQNPMAGFDINSLLGNPQILELLKHLLSGAGAMAGNYFIWIKPLQDKVENMSIKIHEQERRINELERDMAALEKEQENESSPKKGKEIAGDYFNIRGRSSPQGSSRPQRNIRF